MYLVNRFANQTNKKSNLKFLQKGGGDYANLKRLKICLVFSLNSQISITWMMVQHRVEDKSNFGCKKNKQLSENQRYCFIYFCNPGLNRVVMSIS